MILRHTNVTKVNPKYMSGTNPLEMKFNLFSSIKIFNSDNCLLLEINGKNAPKDKQLSTKPVSAVPSSTMVEPSVPLLDSLNALASTKPNDIIGMSLIE